MRLIDTHSHLTDKRFTDIEDVVERARLAGVERIINVGTDLDDSRMALKQASEYPSLLTAAGFHPHNAAKVTEKDLVAMEDLLRGDIIALGEIGLDYYYDFAPRSKQQEVFRSQMEIAEKLALPVIIHNRESHQDVYDILHEFRGRVGGVMHCYSGSAEMALRFIDLGYYISIAGPITFKNARKLPDVVQAVPQEYLLIETDCPYLAPVPYRGKRNEPAYVVEVARKIGEYLDLPLEEVAETTYLNAKRLFGFEDCHA